MKFRSISKLPDDIDVLIRESENEGFNFIRRLKAEWDDEKNCFDQAGECLFAAFSEQRTVGLCGVNIDPYLTDQSVARLRHLYVSPTYRSRSIGSDLVNMCLGNLNNNFNLVRLRAPDDDTGRFYEKFGFFVVDETNATHVFKVS